MSIWLPRLVLATLLAASTQAAAQLSRSFDASNNGVNDTTATSDLNCGPLRCSATYTLETNLVDFAMLEFEWTGPGFSGVLRPGAFSKPPFRTSWNTGAGSSSTAGGNVELFLDGIAIDRGGEAPYHRIQERGLIEALLLGGVESTTTSVERNPLLVEFTSNVERVGSDAYEYVHRVVSHLGEASMFEWLAAELAGDLAPGQMLERRFISPLAPREIATVASFSFDGGDVSGPAFLLVPAAVPAPATAALLLAGLGAVMARRRGSAGKPASATARGR